MRPDKNVLRVVDRSRRDPAFFSKIEREFQIFRELVALAGGQLRFLPLMAVLALLTSLFEGISLTLVIPLVQALGEPAEPQSNGYFVSLLHDGLAAIPVESRVLAILTAILAAVLVKSAVSYANMAVLGVIYGRLSHKLRTRIFAAIVTRPLAEMERERLGKFLNILNNETWRATDALNCIFTMITSLMVLMVFVTLLFLLSWRLALIAVLCMGFIPPVIHLIALRAKKLSKLGLAASETFLLSKHGRHSMAFAPSTFLDGKA